MLFGRQFSRNAFISDASERVLCCFSFMFRPAKSLLYFKANLYNIQVMLGSFNITLKLTKDSNQIIKLLFSLINLKQNKV